MARAVRDFQRVAVKGGHATGKCLACGERIELADGTTVAVETLIGTVFEVVSFGADWLTHRSMATATDNGAQEVVEVVTETGRRLRRTTNHPLMAARVRIAAGVRTKLSSAGWLVAGQLKCGDAILVAEKSPAVGQNPMPDYEVRLLAYILGDGCCGRSSVRFSNVNADVLAEVAADAAAMGCELCRVCKSEPADWRIRRSSSCLGHSNPVHDLLRRHGMWHKGGAVKRVPNAIFRLPDEQIAMFLSRLYATDGWASCAKETIRAQVGYSSVSLGLCEDIQRLLLRLGISGAVNTKPTSWTHKGEKRRGQTSQVMIYRGAMVSRFAERVGIFSKEDAVSRVADAAAAGTKHEAWRTRWALPGFAWERVADVKPLGEQPTVAISVPGDETFLSPVLEHNTAAAAGIMAWMMLACGPCKIVTTAPSTEQVKNETWRELRGQLLSAPAAMSKGLLPKEAFWDMAPDWFAQGFATDFGYRFRGKHSERMLFIFEEAQGIPSWAIEEAENMCTAPGNHILVVGNPINPAGWYADLFKKDARGEGWHTVTLNCLDHPNVVQRRAVTPGAVSWDWVDWHVRRNSVPVDGRDKKPGDFEWPLGSDEWYRPNNVFLSRVLGEFPDEGPDTLISLALITAARNNGERLYPIDDTAPVDIGLDIARMGNDSCVLIARRGPCVLRREKWQGHDTTYSTGRAARVIQGYNSDGIAIGTVAVDAIGIGAGVADNLTEMRRIGEIRADRILAVMVGEKAHDADTYYLKRTELAFGLKQRLAEQMMDLSRLGADADDFESQATQMKYGYHGSQFVLEEKDAFRKRVGVSPDDFDAFCLAFIDMSDYFAENYAAVVS